ncbi:hypothetical protein GS4_08_01400 [Gordonia soli NBRC 108243]|uniref:Uncharacterized protein n=1 Tax=Gordonia soli NBRC 108243 TaxID=1223545 RepID=M0QG06_9ACTN|nr:hypothetical protein GS4_08_01400 [Gordonia soli NBRC 108243]
MCGCRASAREYLPEHKHRAAQIGFLNEYNNNRPNARLGYASPSSRVPRRMYRLTASDIVAPAAI